MLVPVLVLPFIVWTAIIKIQLSFPAIRKIHKMKRSQLHPLHVLIYLQRMRGVGGVRLPYAHNLILNRLAPIFQVQNQSPEKRSKQKIIVYLCTMPYFMSPSQGRACRGVTIIIGLVFFSCSCFSMHTWISLVSKTNKQVTNTCLHFVSDSLDGNSQAPTRENYRWCKLD